MKFLTATEQKQESFRLPFGAPRAMPLQYFTVLGTLAAVTGAAFVFTPFVGAHATALVYLLFVVVLAMITSRGPALMAAAMSALCWDFFFLPPTFAFAIHSFEDAMLFAMYFVVALALGQLTNRIRAQQDAEQRTRLLLESERLGKMLLDSMSHELRTPIAAIQSAVGNMVELENAGLSSFQRSMIDEISEATERLHHLVSNALEINRLESGAVKPKLTRFDPAELVHLCLAATERKLRGHPIAVELDPDLPMTAMDFVLTHEALINLLSNAAVHTPPGTPVEVSGRVEGAWLLLSVADHGPGVEASVRGRIFDKFYRGPNAPVGGTGLGLSLAKGFVEAQGGEIAVGERPGGGAVFTISVPLRQNETLEPQFQRETAHDH